EEDRRRAPWRAGNRESPGEGGPGDHPAARGKKRGRLHGRCGRHGEGRLDAMAQILVVDDEVGIRELLSEILADEGHQVMLAESAGEARRLRERARPDLVLLDIWMPDAEGITLLREWGGSGQLTMRVVMMSGHATIETAVEATRIGALDFLEKPIALHRLRATVNLSLRSPQDACA